VYHGRVPYRRHLHLIGLYLTGVHLIGVYLIGVHLTGVHLMGVYLTGMHLIVVYLTGMHLIVVYLIDVIDLSRSDLQNTSFFASCGGGPYCAPQPEIRDAGLSRDLCLLLWISLIS